MSETDPRHRAGYRRSVLWIAGGAIASALAGCTSVLSGDGDDKQGRAEERIDGSWRMHHSGAGNARFSDATGIRREPTLAWSSEVVGRVQAEPLVSDSLVYVSNLSGELASFEAATGDEYTTVTVGSIGVPSVDATLVYGQLAGDGGLGPFGLLDAATGTRTWEHGVDGIVTSPAIRDGTLYASAFDEAVVYAFDGEDGSLEWSYETVGRPRPVAVGDGRLALATGTYLIVLDVATGDRTWDVLEFEAEPAAPVIADGLTVVSAGTELVAIDERGRRRWSRQPFEAGLGSVGLAGDQLVVGSSQGVTGLDVGAGEQLWRTTETSAGDGVVVTDSVIYAANGPALTGLDRSSGERQWSKRFDEPIQGVSAVPEWLFVLTSSSSDGQNQQGTLHALTDR
jgi:outer membrane protein assembly factor BamB